MSQFLQKLCKVHQENIAQKDKTDKDQFLTCMEIQYQNEIAKVEEKIKEYYNIVENQLSEQDRGNIFKIIDSMKLQKIKLTNHFNERNIKHSQKLRLINEGRTKPYYSFVFNQDSTLLFAGGHKYIKLFKFKNGNKLLQTLIKHSDFIYNMIFMNKSNLLVSGSIDQLIVIWNKDFDSSWKPHQTLEGHSDWINIMINNEDEDLLISGSNDQTLKFWRKLNLNWSCQQTFQTKFSVFGLSLNKSQTKLIICGADGSSEILVMEQKSKKQQWNLTQTIKTHCNGFQLCFLSDYVFVFQGEQEVLEIYQYKQDKGQFIKERQIQIQKHFYLFNYVACKYLLSKGILIIKNGNYLNYFGINKNQISALSQPIEFFNNRVFGNISDDGQFLVTQDQNYIIQVRRLSKIE